jgi:hypothetical protein
MVVVWWFDTRSCTSWIYIIRPSLVQYFDQLRSGYVKVDNTPMHLQVLFTFMMWNTNRTCMRLWWKINWGLSCRPIGDKNWWLFFPWFTYPPCWTRFCSNPIHWWRARRYAFQSLCGASYDEIVVAKKKNQILVNGPQGHNTQVLIERV